MCDFFLHSGSTNSARDIIFPISMQKRGFIHFIPELGEFYGTWLCETLHLSTGAIVHSCFPVASAPGFWPPWKVTLWSFMFISNKHVCDIFYRNKIPKCVKSHLTGSNLATPYSCETLYASFWPSTKDTCAFLVNVRNSSYFFHF